MIQYVKTGEYRSKTLRIKKFVNGTESSTDGFPLSLSLLDAFGTQPMLSEDQLAALSTAEFGLRVEAFKAHVISRYPFLSQTDFVNAAFGTDPSVCTPGEVVGSGSILITSDTEITIFFDSSGSMDATLSPLIQMRNTLLKNALLPFYGMNSQLYDQKVKVVSNDSERTFRMLNNLGTAVTGRKLIMVFQDEANPVYHSGTALSPRTSTFETDMAGLRATLASVAPNTFRAMIFQVYRNRDEGFRFKELMQAVQNGHPSYPLPYNLSDRSELVIQYDVANGQQPQYYMDLIIQKMRESGYRI